MKIADIPAKLPIPFARDAGPGYITQPLPAVSQIGVAAGRASFPDGFPPLTFTQLAAGGDPPWGADFNGLLFQVTSWLRWVDAGGAPVKYDAAFSASVGGYPQGALLQSATLGHYWISKVDDNPTNPDAAGTNWTMFPDTLIQQQSGNYAATDTGAVNHVVITLAPVPVSLASLIGSPIRFLIAHANTIVAPDININGLGAVTMINSDGTAIVIGQFARTGQLIEGYLDPDLAHFQIASPAKPVNVPGVTSLLPPGAIILCPVEIPFAGTLECDGSTKNISDFPRLFNVIKATYGGDGVNTFKVPDLRGDFPRGWDHGRGLDPNSSSRTNRGDGTTGDHVGTNEAQSVRMSDFSGASILIYPAKGGPSYNYNNQIPPPGPQPPYFGGSNFLQTTGGTDGQGLAIFGGDPFGAWPNQGFIAGPFSIYGGAGGIETRPVNIGMMYVIAY